MKDTDWMGDGVRWEVDWSGFFLTKTAGELLEDAVDTSDGA